MFARGLEGWHIIVIVLVVVLLWGAPKLPGMAKSLGESMRIFRKEMKSLGDERSADKKSAEKDSKPDSK
jgi:sec-independent protein translocase protein TatA